MTALISANSGIQLAGLCMVQQQTRPLTKLIKENIINKIILAITMLAPAGVE